MIKSYFGANEITRLVDELWRKSKYGVIYDEFENINEGYMPFPGCPSCNNETMEYDE